MNKYSFVMAAATILLPVSINAGSSHGTGHGSVDNTVIEKQRSMLAKNTENKGFGPQTPRDIDAGKGNNNRSFNAAPAYTDMNL